MTTNANAGSNVINMQGGLSALANQSFSGTQLATILGASMLAGITIVGSGNQFKIESTEDFDWLDEDRAYTSFSDAVAYVVPLLIQHSGSVLTKAQAA